MKKQEEKTEQKKVSFKEKLKNAKLEAKRKLKFAVDYFDKNPEKFGTVVAALFGLIVGGATLVGSKQSAKAEKCQIHDYQTSACWVTERPLTNEDWLKINALMDCEGISLGQALYKLGYLKE